MYARDEPLREPHAQSVVLEPKRSVFIAGLHGLGGFELQGERESVQIGEKLASQLFSTLLTRDLGLLLEGRSLPRRRAFVRAVPEAIQALLPGVSVHGRIGAARA